MDERIKIRVSPDRVIGALLFLCLSSFLLSSPAGGQTANFEGWEQYVNPTYVHNPDRQVLRTFRIPESWDAERLIARAKERIRAKEYARAIPLLQEAVEEHGDKVFQIAVDSLDGMKGTARFIGAAELAQYLLVTLPEEGREAYEAFARDKVGDRLKRAREEEDLDTLRFIGEHYAAAALGREAYSHLAAFYLEQGACESGMIYLKKILQHGNELDEEVTARLVRALDQVGREEEKQRFLDRIEDPCEAFVKDLESNPSVVLSSDSDWATCGGDNSRSKPMPLYMDLSGFTQQWNKAFLNERLEPLSPFATLCSYTGSVPFSLLRKEESLIVNDSVSATAYNIYTGEILWHFRGPLETLDEEDGHYTLEDYVPMVRTTFGRSRPYLRRNMSASTTISPYLIAGGTLAGDKVLLNLQDKRPRREAHLLDRRVINKAIPRRGLFAVDLTTGRQAWFHGDAAVDDDDFLRRLSIPSPPVVIGDRVLVNGFVREGGINTFILSLDLDTGGVNWKASTGIGQQELTMFNMEYKEFTTSPLCEVEGTLLFCSNLGFVCAVDALSGRLRWITEYETIPLPEATHFTPAPNSRRVYWANNPPVVSGDVMIVTPLDSMHLIALDWRTGRPQWQAHSRRLGTEAYPHLLGVHDGKIVLSGKGGAVALATKNGTTAWKVMLPQDREVSGRGAMSDEGLYLPVEGNLFVYDLNGGKVLNTVEFGYSMTPMNIFLFGEVVAGVGPEILRLFFNASQMLAHTLDRANSGAGSLSDLAFIGDMYRLNGELEKAVEYYEKALDASGGRSSRVAKVEASLFNTNLDLGLLMTERGEVEKAEARYRSAFDRARDGDRITRAALALLDLLDALERTEEMASVLERLIDRCPDHVYSFQGEEGLAQAGVGYFVWIKRYRMAVGANDTAAQVEALQAILEHYPEEEFDGQAARPSATERIAALIAREGRKVYADYDREAERAFAKAMEEDRVALLERIAMRYPNAQNAGRVALEIARRYLDAGDAASVFRYLTDYLQTHRDGAEKPHALYLLALAADRDQNFDLARALKMRILERHAASSPPWDSETTYRKILEGVRRAEFQRVEVPGLPRSDFEVAKANFTQRQGRLARTLGREPSFMQGKVLLEFEVAGTVMLYDYSAMVALWSRDLGRFYTHRKGGELLNLIHTGEVLTVVFETMAVGLDLRTGETIWEYDPGGLIMDTGFAMGLLCVITVPMYGEDLMEEMAAVALNPMNGTLLWRRDVDYAPHPRILASSEVFCFAAKPRKLNPMIVFLDPLTGLDIDRIDAEGDFVMPLSFDPPPGKVLAVVSRRKEGGTAEHIKFLEAFDARKGGKLWSLSLERWFAPVNNCLRAGDMMAIFARERSGRRGSKVLLLVDLMKGEVAGQWGLGNDYLVDPDDKGLTNDLVLLHTGRTRNILSLSAFDIEATEFRFREREFAVGDAGTNETVLQDAVYAADGVVIPLDFTLNRASDQVLWSQVLLISAREGRLLYALDLYWEGRDRVPSMAMEYFPVQVGVRHDAVLVYKRSELYVIRGSRSGG